MAFLFRIHLGDVYDFVAGMRTAGSGTLPVRARPEPVYQVIRVRFVWAWVIVRGQGGTGRSARMAPGRPEERNPTVIIQPE